MKKFYKKPLVVLTLLFSMCTSLVAGTLARYQTTIDNIESGTLVAKDFVFLAERSDAYTTSVKIAPGESVTYSIKIKNYEGTLASPTNITEVPMDVSFTVAFAGDLAGFDHIVVDESAMGNTTLGITAEDKTVNVIIKWYKDKADYNANEQTAYIGTDLEYNALDTAKVNKTGTLTIVATATQKID